MNANPYYVAIDTTSSATGQLFIQLGANEGQTMEVILPTILEHAYESVTNTAENLTAAESRICDTDMAKEMMKFTKQNILMQAAQSMLSQATQQLQGVLQLLGKILKIFQKNY